MPNGLVNTGEKVMQSAAKKIRTIQDGHILGLTHSLRDKIELLSYAINSEQKNMSQEEVTFALVAARESMSAALRFIQMTVCPHHGRTWHEGDAKIDKCIICGGRLGHEQEQG